MIVVFYAIKGTYTLKIRGIIRDKFVEKVRLM